MNKPNLTKIVNDVKTAVSKHSPEILTGIGIAGMITSTVLAVKATPKAERLIKEAETKKGESLTRVEKAKACWKCYIPAAVTTVTATACLVGASSVHARRNAALATAYKLSETAIAEYREKVVETIGETKEQLVRDKVDKAQVEKKPVEKSEVYVTNRGSTLCYDYMSGRYFESDIDAIKKAENELNKRMLRDTFGYVSMNEFYEEIGLDHIGMGDYMGWNVNNLIDIHFGSQIATDGRPCIVITHNNAPDYEYDR